MKTLFLIAALTLASIWHTPSYAISEYGRTCEDNSDCRHCRDKDVKCQTCMNNCWNLYGPAEFAGTTTLSHDREELCRIRRAKWCNAQCWDPDDRTNPDYASSKPDCSETTAYPNYQNTKRPW
jgi:hypothetical protein